MNMKMIAAACVAFCGASAFAAVTPSCNTTAAAADGVTLLKTCAPQITFYGAGATAMKSAIQAVLATDGKVFDKSKPFVTITLSGDSNAYAYYGYGATGKAYAGKRVAVIVNGNNGSMAGVNQLLTGLKSGSVEGGVDQQEYKTIALHTAADQKAGTPMPDAHVTVTTASALAPVVTLANNELRKRDFKSAWGEDKQKVAHMAFSDVRPSEATPGQIAKWDAKAFPSETIAMQGFGVLVNTAMYKALQTRDIAAKRMDSGCQDDLTTAACQPNIFTPDYTALITGKVTSAADLGLTGTLTLNRRPASSGTQASTQIRFAGEANYFGKTPLATGFDMAGAEITNTTGVAVGDVTVKTWSGTGDLITGIRTGSGLQIGVASLDNSAASKLGASSSVVRADQQAFWVKLDGQSPDFTGASATALDSKYRTALMNGYSFAMEFQTLKSAKLAGDYSAIYSDIVAGLKDPAANLTGIGYIASTDATKNTAWTRGGNNFFPLNKY